MGKTVSGIWNVMSFCILLKNTLLYTINCLMCSFLMCVFIQWIFLPNFRQDTSTTLLANWNLARTLNLIFPKLNLASQFPNLSCVLCLLLVVKISHLPGSSPSTVFHLFPRPRRLTSVLLITAWPPLPHHCAWVQAPSAFTWGCCSNLFIHLLEFALSAL